jgi:hypothetical protein
VEDVDADAGAMVVVGFSPVLGVGPPPFWAGLSTHVTFMSGLVASAAFMVELVNPVTFNVELVTASMSTTSTFFCVSSNMQPQTRATDKSRTRYLMDTH